jgi:hypothetical protein
MAAMLAVVATLLVWRRSVAWLRATRENETDVALWIESRQQLDGDLVAAVQFEPPTAAAWGSRQLELAIVDYVADFSETLAVAPERPSRASLAWGLLLLVTSGVSAWCAVTRHEVAATFADRLTLGASHYPTRTRILSVAIDERDVSSDTNELKRALGAPLRFEVRCAGELPGTGRMVLTNVTSGESTEIELARRMEFTPFERKTDGSRSEPSMEPAADATYVAHLPRLVDSLRYQIVIGDASTEPASLNAVAAPVLTVSLDCEPPDYAAGEETQSAVTSGATRIAVLEGSRVEVEVVSKNKRLEQVTLQLGGEPFELQPSDDSRRRWRLRVRGTPLEHVVESLPFRVRATDIDALEPPQPLSGMISLTIDRPPRVVASAITQEILPQARPTVQYAARDDYGISRLLMRRELLRPGEGADALLLDVAIEPTHAKSVDGTMTLELGDLRLVKGDQLRITFEATDFRGAGEGTVGTSEPLVLSVTDARGLLAGMSGADESSKTELDRLIEQQLGEEIER